MGCGRRDVEEWRDRTAARWERKRERWERRMQRWGGHMSTGMSPSGNRAFDEYREQALRRLEDEATEFRDFLARLRHAKDRAEFDDFMRDRRERPQGPVAGAQDTGPQPQS